MRISRLALALAAFGILAPAPSHADGAPVAPIQPGARIRMGNSWCTANFVFTDGVQRYIGTAGHCVGLGSTVRDDNGVRIGTVVFSENAYPVNDFALIAIDPERYGDVSPSMRVWGGPTGIAPAGVLGEETTLPGTLVRQHGYGTTWQQSELTRPRTGVLDAVVAQNFSAILPCSGGDSGSGVILASGEAVGVLDVAMLAPAGLVPALAPVIGKISPRCGGTSLERVLARLAGAGFTDLQLETAPLAPLA